MNSYLFIQEQTVRQRHAGINCVDAELMRSGLIPPLVLQLLAEKCHQTQQHQQREPDLHQHQHRRIGLPGDAQ